MSQSQGNIDSDIIYISLLECFPDISREFIAEKTSEFFDANVDNEHITLNNNSVVEWISVHVIETLKGNYPKQEFGGGASSSSAAGPSSSSSSSSDRIYQKDEIYNSTVTLTDMYKEQSFNLLQNNFDTVGIADIKKALAETNNRYGPAKTKLEEWVKNSTGSSSSASSGPRLKLLKGHRGLQAIDMQGLDKLLDMELKYMHQEESSKKVEEERAKKKEELYNEAEKAGTLITCGCCYCDTALELMVQCREGHLFCCDCVEKYVEEMTFGQMRKKDKKAEDGTMIGDNNPLPCMDSEGCTEGFVLSQVQHHIPVKLWNCFMKRQQEDDLARAGLANLHTCPICKEYKAEVENVDDKVFKCLNPSCGKETCRLCGEENHVPLRCNEVEKKGQKSKRVFFEEAMTAAKIRTCVGCKTPYVKQDGCNKITCPSCHKYQCYVCRAQIKDYSHFQTPGAKCQLHTSTEEDDKLAVAEAAKEADAKWRALHPDEPDDEEGGAPKIAVVEKALEESKAAEKAKAARGPPPGMIQPGMGGPGIFGGGFGGFGGFGAGIGLGGMLMGAAQYMPRFGFGAAPVQAPAPAVFAPAPAAAAAAYGPPPRGKAARKRWDRQRQQEAVEAFRQRQVEQQQLQAQRQQLAAQQQLLAAQRLAQQAQAQAQARLLQEQAAAEARRRDELRRQAETIAMLDNVHKERMRAEQAYAKQLAAAVPAAAAAAAAAASSAAPAPKRGERRTRRQAAEEVVADDDLIDLTLGREAPTPPRPAKRSKREKEVINLDD